MFVFQNVADNIDRISSESSKLISSTMSERKEMAVLCEKTYEAAAYVNNSMLKLRELKANSLNLLRENVKVRSNNSGLTKKASMNIIHF